MIIASYRGDEQGRVTLYNLAEQLLLFFVKLVPMQLRPDCLGRVRQDLVQPVRRRQQATAA